MLTGDAIFVGSLLDIQTYLADLNDNFGALYAGLYLVILSVVSIVAVYYAQKKHSWKNYHLYTPITSEDNENDIK